MDFTHISLQRVLKILMALREVSDDLSKCRMKRTEIFEGVLKRKVPGPVLTLAATHELSRMVERRRFAGMNGQTEYWFLTAYGDAFLADPSKPPKVKAEPVVYTEPEDAKKLRLARGKRERRRQAQIDRNRRKGVDPADYNVVVEDVTEAYGNGDLRRLPIPGRIAVLRSCTGENRQAQKDLFHSGRLGRLFLPDRNEVPRVP